MTEGIVILVARSYASPGMTLAAKSVTEMINNQILLSVSIIIGFFLYGSSRKACLLWFSNDLLGQCLEKRMSAKDHPVLKQAVWLAQSSLPVVYWMNSILGAA
jgi:hypothetical protein